MFNKEEVLIGWSGLLTIHLQNEQEGKVILCFEKKLSDPVRPDMDADWVKEYQEKNGRCPNLFDGV